MSIYFNNKKTKIDLYPSGKDPGGGPFDPIKYREQNRNSN